MKQDTNLTTHAKLQADSNDFDSEKTTLSDQIAVKTITPIRGARLQPKSLRLVINTRCYDCIYDKADVGSWRQEVAACPNTNCPLNCQRPRPIKLGVAA
jgi:hypothetical protein